MKWTPLQDWLFVAALMVGAALCLWASQRFYTYEAPSAVPADDQADDVCPCKANGKGCTCPDCDCGRKPKGEKCKPGCQCFVIEPAKPKKPAVPVQLTAARRLRSATYVVVQVPGGYRIGLVGRVYPTPDEVAVEIERLRVHFARRDIALQLWVPAPDSPILVAGPTVGLGVGVEIHRRLDVIERRRPKIIVKPAPKVPGKKLRKLEGRK